MSSPVQFYENFKSQLVKDALNCMEQEQISLESAFIKIVSKWLGYDIPDEDYLDGAGDRGIDFWFASDTNIELYQVKTHELDDNYNIKNLRFDNEGVNDIKRIKSFLLSNDIPKNLRPELKKVKERWNYIITTLKSNADIKHEKVVEPFIVKIGLIIIGEYLTQQANDEFLAFKRENEKVTIVSDNVPLKFEIVLITLKDILDVKWREENREWKDIDGKVQKWIELRVDKHSSNKDNWISTPKSVIFYCPLIDLVMAYRKFGYQIFEPNVRCNIKKSRINAGIKESIKRQSSRKEFRY